MPEAARYIDAEKLKIALSTMYPAVGTSYSSGQVENQINMLISGALMNALESFKHQIINAIDQAATPYDKCLLCVQKDSCIPPHPLGDNR